MMRSDFACDAQAARFGPAHLGERPFRGKMGDVKPAAGKFGNLHVARDANGLRGGGHSAETEPSGRDAFTHDGSGGERNILGVFDDGQVERSAVIQDLSREFRSGDRLSIV